MTGFHFRAKKFRVAGTEISGTGSGRNISGGSSTPVMAEARVTVCTGLAAGGIAEECVLAATVGEATAVLWLAGAD